MVFYPVLQALKRRVEIFKKFALPDVLGDGRVTTLTPLQIADETSSSSYGGYGIALSPTLNQFVVCKSVMNRNCFKVQTPANSTTFSPEPPRTITSSF